MEYEKLKVVEMSIEGFFRFLDCCQNMKNGIGFPDLFRARQFGINAVL